MEKKKSEVFVCFPLQLLILQKDKNVIQTKDIRVMQMCTDSLFEDLIQEVDLEQSDRKLPKSYEKISEEEETKNVSSLLIQLRQIKRNCKIHYLYR